MNKLQFDVFNYNLTHTSHHDIYTIITCSCLIIRDKTERTLSFGIPFLPWSSMQHEIIYPILQVGISADETSAASFAEILWHRPQHRLQIRIIATFCCTWVYTLEMGLQVLSLKYWSLKLLIWTWKRAIT